jgi:alcohol dehydrogenase class IV
MTDAICREGLRQWRDGSFSLAAMFSGMALANAGLGAVHGFSGPIGGMFDAPHGALCAALLPHVLAVNKRRAAKERFAEVEQIVGDVGQLCRALEIPPLRKYGLRREDFPAIIEKATASSSMKGNPVQLTHDEMQEILASAF